MDAQPGERQSGEQRNVHGTGQAPSSGLEGLTLFERLLIQRLDVLIDQHNQLIDLLLDEPEQGGPDAQPTRYLNGHPI